MQKYIQEIHKSKENKKIEKRTLQESYNKLTEEVGDERKKVARKNCKKKPKQRRIGATEDKEHNGDKIKAGRGNKIIRINKKCY